MRRIKIVKKIPDQDAKQQLVALSNRVKLEQEQAEAVVARAEEKVGITEKKLETVDKKLAATLTLITTKEEELRTLRDSIAAKKGELLKFSTDLDAKIAGERNLIMKAIASDTKKAKEVSDKLADLNEDIIALSLKKTTIESEVASAQKTLADTAFRQTDADKKLKDTLDAIAVANDRLTQILQQLSEAKTTLEKQAEAIKQNVVDIEKATISLEQKLKAAVEMDKIMRAKEVELKDLEAKIEDITKVIAEVNMQKIKNQEYAAKLDKKAQKLGVLIKL